MKNKPYFIALNHIHPLGSRTVCKLWAQWPSLQDMFGLATKDLVQATGLPWSVANAIRHFNFRCIEPDLRWAETKDHYILTLDDPNYPGLLREIHDPPAVIYARGDLSCLKPAKIAMIGSRKPSILGIETARRFAANLATAQFTVVSGLALGIDAQVHQGCLDVNGSTIAVMGTGIDLIYPGQHKHLAERICQRGLLLSEFSLSTPPKARHFPQRNRIISGLTLATVVIEAANKSGSLITARLAVEQNREVFAIPGSIFNPQAMGCHYLIQQGAKLVTNIEDILSELGLLSTCATSLNTKTEYKNTDISLVKDQQKLVKYIGFELTTLDQIVARSKLDIEKVTKSLANLELDGVIKAIPGGYMRCA